MPAPATDSKAMSMPSRAPTIALVKALQLPSQIQCLPLCKQALPVSLTPRQAAAERTVSISRRRRTLRGRLQSHIQPGIARQESSVIDALHNMMAKFAAAPQVAALPAAHRGHDGSPPVTAPIGTCAAASTDVPLPGAHGRGSAAVSPFPSAIDRSTVARSGSDRSSLGATAAAAPAGDAAAHARAAAASAADGLLPRLWQP